MKLRVLCLIPIWVSTLAGQTQVWKSILKTAIAPAAEVRSEVLSVVPGTTVKVTWDQAKPGSPPVETYIYDTDKVLLAKDDHESDHFEWESTAALRIYILVANYGPSTRTVEMTMLPPPASPPGRPRAAAPQLAVMPVYYATDRAFVGKPDEAYGSDPTQDGRLEYGLCRVSIPRDHKMGELEGPAIWKLEFSPDPSKHVAIVGAPVRASEQEFFEELKKESAGSDKKQALIFIHGFDNTFNDAARRTGQIAYDLGFHGLTILYSWPSHGAISPIAYNADLRNANNSVERFEKFLTDLCERTGVEKVDIIAHSMGSVVLSRGLNELALRKANTKVREVILMAPDIDASLFKQMAAKMKSESKKITLYASSKDEALKASMTYAGGYTRAGQGGKDILVLPGVDTIDASSVNTSLIGFMHQYYADSREILSDVFQLMRGTPVNQRFGLEERGSGAQLYWAFRP